MTADTILTVQGIDVFYGASKILFGVDLGIGRGRTLALLGRNGAGKSTTLKAIAGVARPRTGSVRLGATELAGARPDVIARAGIGYVPEDRQVFPMCVCVGVLCCCRRLLLLVAGVLFAGVDADRGTVPSSRA